MLDYLDGENWEVLFLSMFSLAVAGVLVYWVRAGLLFFRTFPYVRSRAFFSVKRVASGKSFF